MRHRLDFGARGAWFGPAALVLLILPLGVIAQEETASAGAGPQPRVDAPEAATPIPAPPSPWSGDLWTRSQLSGDWLGLRDNLAATGVTFWGDITQYYQGVTSGGTAQQFRYGGRGDYLLDVDSGKLGLWSGVISTCVARPASARMQSHRRQRINFAVTNALPNQV